MAEAGALRWGVEQRLAFVDACLHWAGRVNRSDLVSRFGISVPQASADLARYLEVAPANAEYDRTRKAYVVAPTFHPAFPVRDSLDVLAEIGREHAGEATGSMAPWGAGIPVEHAVPRTRRIVDGDVVRRLMAATRDGLMVRVQYRSLSHAGATDRWIAPHAFADDGDRWHVRAFCVEHREYRDFLVSRIAKVGESVASPVPSELDLAWHTEVTMRLAPHPRLDDGAKRALEAEHGMRDGYSSLTTRTCFAFYVEARLGLDLADEDVPVHRNQLILVNPDEVRRAEACALKATKAALRKIEQPCGVGAAPAEARDPVRHRAISQGS